MMVMGVCVCVGISPLCLNEDSKVNSQHYPLQIESSSPTQLLLLSAGWQSISGKNATTFTFAFCFLPSYLSIQSLGFMSGHL